jgi:hypothetical protein
MNNYSNKTAPYPKKQTSKREWEDRPNWATCYPPREPRTEHPPSFTGVTVIGGRKHWINVYLKTDRNGTQFASVNVKVWEDRV